MRIRIDEPGMENFSDFMGALEFKNGVSLRAPEDWELRSIGASFRITKLDDDGKEIGQGGPGADVVSARNVGIEPEPRLKRTPGPVSAGKTPQTKGEMELLPRIYTEEELEKIADVAGINGLRKVAAIWNVKARSIPDLLQAILAAQTAAKAKVREKARKEAQG